MSNDIKNEKGKGAALTDLTNNPQVMMAFINSGKERLTMLQQELGQLSTRIAEIGIAIKTLKYMEKNTEEKLMLPIGAGIYIQAGIPKDSKIFSEIGSGAILKKDRKNALETLEDANGKAEQLQRQLLIEQSQISAKVNETNMQLQGMMGQKA